MKGENTAILLFENKVWINIISPSRTLHSPVVEMAGRMTCFSTSPNNIKYKGIYLHIRSQGLRV